MQPHLLDGKCPSDTPLGELIQAQLAAWPEHEKFLLRSFENRSPRLMQTTTQSAELVYQMISPRFEEFARSYKWLCSQINRELLEFLRTGHYRYSSFEEVARCVYNDPSYMTAYMQGVLLSQLFWLNHASSIDYYVHEFLPSLPEQSRLLEIGPGHGLLTVLAVLSPQVAAVIAVDSLSASSLSLTAEHLERLGLRERVLLIEADGSSPSHDPNDTVDAIVLSELLEHVEDPGDLLRGIKARLRPGGLVFVNVPVNSPELDHIYLLESPEEALELIGRSGFVVSNSRCFPATGYSEETARRRRFTISCVMTASLPRDGVL